MNLPRKWENAIDKAMKERIWGCSRSELQLLAYKLCALTQKPQRELTDAELLTTFNDAAEKQPHNTQHLAGLRAVIAADRAKQREPATVKFRAARLKSSGEVEMFRPDDGKNLGDAWEWLEPAQEIEVTLP